jgi:hypothetical protein
MILLFRTAPWQTSGLDWIIPRNITAKSDPYVVRIMRHLLVSMILAVSGFVTPPTQIIGRYATRLCDSDLRQIKRVVASDPKLDHRVAEIARLR